MLREVTVHDDSNHQEVNMGMDEREVRARALQAAATVCAALVGDSSLPPDTVARYKAEVLRLADRYVDYIEVGDTEVIAQPRERTLVLARVERPLMGSWTDDGLRKRQSYGDPEYFLHYDDGSEEHVTRDQYEAALLSHRERTV